MRDKQKLSPQQEEIVRLGSDGRSNREIAEALGVGTRAVETQIRRIRQKLGTHDRRETLTTAVVTLEGRNVSLATQLAALTNLMPVYVVAFDEQFELAYANEKARDLDLVSHARQHPLKALWKAIAPEQGRQRLHNPKPVDFDDHKVRMKSTDGQERVVSWSSSAKTNPIAGWGAWAIGADVTDMVRKETDVELQKLALPNQAAVWALDNTMRTLSASPALEELLGVSHAQLENSAISDFLPQDQYPVLRDIVHSGEEDVPIVLQRADRERIAVQVTCRIRKTSEEPLDGMVLIVKRPPKGTASLRAGA